MERRDHLPTSSVVGRIAAIVALAVAVVVVAILLLGGGDDYEVTAEFENASQLVGGEQVVVGGVPVGKVSDIALGDNGQALVTFSVSDDYAPLKEGTTATVRSFSLSGIANRQVQLTLPPEGQDTGGEIPDGATMDQSQTVSEVDLDQVFNTLDDRTVANLKKVIRGFEISYDGVAKQANRGFHYLNPFLSSSRRVFAELTYDDQSFERLIVDSSRLSGALAQRAPDIAALVHNLNTMMGAIGRHKESLARGRRGAARLHAQLQHDGGQPPRHARRPRPAGRRVEARRPAARPVLRRAARDRGRCRADDPRPRSHRQAAEARQRPRRPDQAPGPAREHRGRPGPGEWGDAYRAPSRSRCSRSRTRCRSCILPRLHARAGRLVRRLRVTPASPTRTAASGGSRLLNAFSPSVIPANVPNVIPASPNFSFRYRRRSTSPSRAHAREQLGVLQRDRHQQQRALPGRQRAQPGRQLDPVHRRRHARLRPHQVPPGP